MVMSKVWPGPDAEKLAELNQTRPEIWSGQMSFPGECSQLINANQRHW